jgi:hypothetical protein
LSGDNFLSPDVVFVFSSVKNLNEGLHIAFSKSLSDVNGKTKYRPWSEIEIYFRSLRVQTTFELLFCHTQFPWLSFIDLNIAVAQILEVASSNSENVKMCFNHGDLGSENILYTENQVYVIDFECSGENLPWLVDPIAVYLDSRSGNLPIGVYCHFKQHKKIDVVLALLYLKHNSFPPAVKALDDLSI